MLLYLFLVLVNSQVFRSWYCNSSLSSFLMVITLSIIPINSYPNYFAAYTRASSSGEADVYMSFFLSKMTVWQRAMQRITSTNSGVFSSKWLFNFGSWKLTFGYYDSVAYLPVPYDTNPAENFLNSIMLQVSVPVLSENMYSTWPSSSFKLLAAAFAKMT